MEGMENPSIDYFESLKAGLRTIAEREPNSGSTERFRKPEEHPAPVRIASVKEVDLSLEEFLAGAPRRSGVGQRLKSARLAAGMTQLTVAMRLGFARSSISMIENESRPLRPGELDSFAKLYGVDVASLKAG